MISSLGYLINRLCVELWTGLTRSGDESGGEGDYSHLSDVSAQIEGSRHSRTENDRPAAWRDTSVTITWLTDLHIIICDRVWCEERECAVPWQSVLSMVTYPAPDLGLPPPFVDVSSWPLILALKIGTVITNPTRLSVSKPEEWFHLDASLSIYDLKLSTNLSFLDSNFLHRRSRRHTRNVRPEQGEFMFTFRFTT